MITALLISGSITLIYGLVSFVLFLLRRRDKIVREHFGS